MPDPLGGRKVAAEGRLRTAALLRDSSAHDEKKTARAEARAVVSSSEFVYGMVIWIVLLFDNPPLSTTVSVIDGVAPAGKG